MPTDAQIAALRQTLVEYGSMSIPDDDILRAALAAAEAVAPPPPQQQTAPVLLTGVHPSYRK